MPSIRIWILESDYDAKAVKCLADKLVTHLQLDHLSIQASGKGAIPRRNRRGESSTGTLRTAVGNYLKQDACVIFVIDSDSPMSTHQRRQEPNSLFNQIDQVVADSSLSGKVFLAQAVQELEAWLLIDCLGITCYFASKRRQYKEGCREKVSTDQPFSRLLSRYQKGNTEDIVEAEPGGRGAKEFLTDFSEKILHILNLRIPQKNVKENRYREKMSPDMAKHVVIDQETLQRNASLRKLGHLLAQFR